MSPSSHDRLGSHIPYSPAPLLPNTGRLQNI